MPVLKKANPHLAHQKRPVSTENDGDPVIMTYRALAPLRVADDDSGETTHIRNYGDFVPEAATWKKPDAWLRTGKMEVVYVNQSELDKWRKMYKRRIREEDKELAEQNAAELEILELQKRIKALEAQQAAEKKAAKSGAGPVLKQEKVIEEKIDFGGVKMADGGLPRPVALPEVTRAPLPQRNVAENRTSPTTVRKAVRKRSN